MKRSFSKWWVSSPEYYSIDNTLKKWIAIYDIRDISYMGYTSHIRTMLLVRELYKYGYRVQKSVFELEINFWNLERLCQKVKTFLLPEDKFYLYPLGNFPVKGRIERYGNYNNISNDFFI